MTKVLVVEDDPAILRGLADNLRFEGYEVFTAQDGESGARLQRVQKPDLIVLDLMMPRLGGLELCRRLRGEGIQTPILMLTAKSEEADRVAGLDLGADDYVTKPFSVKELMARIRALLRRAQPSQNLLPASTCAPQLGQTAANVAPHSRQKRAPSRLSAWHRGHFRPGPPSISGRGRSQR